MSPRKHYIWFLPLSLFAAVGIISCGDFSSSPQVSEQENAIFGGTPFTPGNLPFDRWRFASTTHGPKTCVNGTETCWDCTGTLVAKTPDDVTPTDYVVATAGHCGVVYPNATGKFRGSYATSDFTQVYSEVHGTAGPPGADCDNEYQDTGDTIGLGSIQNGDPAWSIAEVTNGWSQTNVRVLSVDWDGPIVDPQGAGCSPFGNPNCVNRWDPVVDVTPSVEINAGRCPLTAEATMENATRSAFDSGAILFDHGAVMLEGQELASAKVNGFVFGNAGNETLKFIHAKGWNAATSAMTNKVVDEVLAYMGDKGTIIQKYHCETSPQAGEFQDTGACADFNLDGRVDLDDYQIVDFYEGNMPSDATKGHGDADCDGDVDMNDLLITEQAVFDENQNDVAWDCQNRRCGNCIQSPMIP